MLRVENADYAPALARYCLLLRHQVNDGDAKLLAQFERMTERGMLARLDIIMHNHHKMRQGHLLRAIVHNGYSSRVSLSATYGTLAQLFQQHVQEQISLVLACREESFHFVALRLLPGQCMRQIAQPLPILLLPGGKQANDAHILGRVQRGNLAKKTACKVGHNLARPCNTHRLYLWQRHTAWYILHHCKLSAELLQFGEHGMSNFQFGGLDFDKKWSRTSPHAHRQEVRVVRPSFPQVGTFLNVRL